MTESDGSTVVSTGRQSPGLLVIGAGVIVADWILLGLLAGEWNPGAIYVALSLMIVLAAFGVGGISIGTGTQRAIGWFVGLAALVIVLADLRFDGFPGDGVRVLAYFLFVAGAVLMLLGARALND